MKTPVENRVATRTDIGNVMEAGERLTNIVAQGEKGAQKLRNITERTAFLKQFDRDLSIFCDNLQHHCKGLQEKRTLIEEVHRSCFARIKGLSIPLEQKKICFHMVDDIFVLGWEDGDISDADIQQMYTSFLERFEDLLLKGKVS